MAVLIVLPVSWLIFRGIGALGVTALAAWQDSVRYALAVMFVFTAIAHCNRMKRDLADDDSLVLSTAAAAGAGVHHRVLELLGAGAAGLLLPKFRNQIASQASRRRTRQMARGSEGIADMSNRIEVEKGSGNVFADIGLPNPEERLAKADLAIVLAKRFARGD